MVEEAAFLHHLKNSRKLKASSSHPTLPEPLMEAAEVYHGRATCCYRPARKK